MRSISHHRCTVFLVAGAAIGRLPVASLILPLLLAILPLLMRGLEESFGEEARIFPIQMIERTTLLCEDFDELVCGGVGMRIACGIKESS